MHLIIIGAGRTGRHIIAEAVRDGHEVVVIEKEEKVANWAAATYDCMVIHADATSVEALRQANASHADALIVTTSDDAVNMLAILLGKELGIQRLISSVTNEDHIRLFEQMGIDTVENPYRLNGQYLYRAVNRPNVKDFLDLGSGFEIVEFHVEAASQTDGKLVKELNQQQLLPRNTRIVVIRHGSEIVIPEGETPIFAGDLVAVLCPQTEAEKLARLFKK